MNSPEKHTTSDAPRPEQRSETDRKSRNTRRSPKGHRCGRLILALLEQPSIEKAADSIRMSRSTAYRIRQTEEFQREYLQARQHLMAQASARLQQGTNAAASTFLRLMVDDKQRGATRLRAAERVWVFSNQAIDAEIRAVPSYERGRRGGAAEAALEKLHKATEALAKFQPAQPPIYLPKLVINAVLESLSDEDLEILIRAAQAGVEGERTPEEEVVVLHYAQLLEEECRRLGFASVDECQRLYNEHQMKVQRRNLLRHLSDEQS